MMLVLSPHGRLTCEDGGDDSIAPRHAEQLRAAAGQSGADALLWLAGPGLDLPLTPSLAFWRELARRCLTRLCHVPEGAADAPEPPPLEELGSLAEAAPPMAGAEYIRAETLAGLWRELETLARDRMRGHPEGSQSWLKALHPLWNMVGRVTFHLAENKRDPERPFAFLATYTRRVSEGGAPQYLPLARALQDYAGARNRAALLSILAPVRRAAEKSALVRELAESRRIYEPQRWTANEAHRFLLEAPAIEESGVLLRMPDWWKGGRPPRPAVRLTVGSREAAGVGLDAILDFDVALVLDGEELTAAERRRIAAADAGLILLKGRWVEVDRDKLKTVLDHWTSLESGRREGVSFAEGLRLLAGAASGDSSLSSAPEAVRTWTQLRAGPWLEDTLRELRTPAGATLPPPGLRGTLRPYQLAGVHWLRFLGRLGFGACLADDMGLGKTIQVLGAVLHARSQPAGADPFLLVVPASLLGNWKEEAARFAPSLKLFVAHPSETPAAALEAIGEDGSAFGDCDLVVCTYGMLARQEGLRRRGWSGVILDEAQAIKNPGARQTRAVKELRTPVRIALTGTPVENSLGDLWSLFDFLNPGLLGTAAEFSRAVKNMASAGRADAYAPLRQLVRPYILRRMKSDRAVIADLPDKTEVAAYCPLSRRQAVLYEETVAGLKEGLAAADGIARRGLVLASLLRLKQICNHPDHALGSGEFRPQDSGKFQRLAEIASEIAQRREKALVFTQFREITEPLARFLATVFGRAGLVLHGGTPVKQRPALVADFQREEGPPFFVLSVKAGGTGLNLTEAGHVIHFDRWWNPAVENQATDRAYRIGQKRNVLVHKFVCRGTAEERIDALIAEKQALAREVLGAGAEVALTEMPDEELLRFVSLDLRAASAET